MGRPALLLAILAILALPGEGAGEVAGISEFPQESEAPRPAAEEPGQTLRVALVTIGPGDAVWEKFSHNAILIEDRATGRSRAYHWGVFDFDQVDFIPRLIRGTMLYSMATVDPDWAFAAYARQNRSVWVQDLALTPRQRSDLLTFVEWNARPENRAYRYDYYRDNCSTRVRDALDRVLGGEIRRRTEADITAHTYRWHTRRLLQTVPPAYVGIQLVLGGAADEPLTAWEEMFLPIRLQEELRTLDVVDAEGVTRPLVIREEQVMEAVRPPIPTAPPFAFPWFLLVGLLWSGAVLLLGRRSSGGDEPGWVRRLGIVVLGGGWSLVAGVSGVLLLGAWLFTDHVFWYRNLNLLQMSPFALFLTPAFALFLFAGRFPRWGWTLARLLAGVSVLGVLVEILPGLGQRNAEILALTLPVNLSLALCAFWLSDPGRSGGGGTRHEASSDGSDGVPGT